MSDDENVSRGSASESSTPQVKPESQAAAGSAGPSAAASSLDEANENISISVTDGTSDVTFKIKRKTALSKVMDSFCKRIGKQRSSLRFLVDGERVQDDDTAASLGLENNDRIEALNQQTGGSVFSQ